MPLEILDPVLLVALLPAVPGGRGPLAALDLDLGSHPGRAQSATQSPVQSTQHLVGYTGRSIGPSWPRDDGDWEPAEGTSILHARGEDQGTQAYRRLSKILAGACPGLPHATSTALGAISQTNRTARGWPGRDFNPQQRQAGSSGRPRNCQPPPAQEPLGPKLAKTGHTIVAAVPDTPRLTAATSLAARRFYAAARLDFNLDLVLDLDLDRNPPDFLLDQKS